MSNAKSIQLPSSIATFRLEMYRLNPYEKKAVPLQSGADRKGGYVSVGQEGKSEHLRPSGTSALCVPFIQPPILTGPCQPIRIASVESRVKIDRIEFLL
jgi:hypothetical protein